MLNAAALKIKDIEHAGKLLSLLAIKSFGRNIIEILNQLNKGNKETMRFD